MTQMESPLADADETPLAEIVTDRWVGELLRTDHQNLADAQKFVLETLEILGPQTMDDSIKYSVVRQLVGILRVLEIEDDVIGSEKIPEEYRSTGGAGGRGPHYHPLAEMSELDEPTYEALANRYSAMEGLTNPDAENAILGLQINLAVALDHLSDTHFAGQDDAMRLLLGAMAVVDRTHSRQTYLTTEQVTVTETVDVGAGSTEIEVDTTDISITLK